MSWRWKMKFTNLMAKALYDNKAETPDELAFRKGDILTVIEQNIKGDEGWWRCSLHGRQGIVPGNRLQLLTGSQYDIPSLYPSPCSTLRRQSQQSFYQMPTKQHQSSPSSSVSGLGDNVYQVPSRPQSYGQHYQVPASSAEYCWDRGQVPPRQVFTLPRTGQGFSLNSISGSYADAYDIPPSHVPRVQGGQMSGSPATARKYSMFQTEGERRLIQQLYDIPLSFERPRAATQNQVYDVPPRASLDGPAGCYDIPAPMGLEFPGRDSRRSPWDEQDDWRAQRQALYDVPVPREGAAPLYSVPPPQGEAAGLRGPSRNPWPGSGQALYDVPTGQGGRVYDTPPRRLPAGPNAADIYDVPVNLPKPAAAPPGPPAIYDLPRVAQPGRKGPAGAEPLYDVPPQVSREPQSSQGSERSQNVVAASPAMPGPPATSTPPAEEIRLGAEAAAATLSQLQQQMSESVTSIMEFVSSRWRLREHLQEHLGQIRSAAGSVVSRLGAFLSFVRGVKVNATRLTDANLQSRLCKQLEVVEDSHQILLETSRALAACDWNLDVLVVTTPEATPDHLDRFVMVTRTVPDDVKRLVSIIIANGKLLFNQKQEGPSPQGSPAAADRAQGTSQAQPRLQMKANLSVIKHKAPVPTPPRREQNAKPSPPTRIEDCDYVQLQRKEEFQRQEKEKESIRQREKESFKQKKLLLERQMSEAKIRKPGDASVRVSLEVIHPPASSSELCKTYFSALQKAIMSFTDTINGNQPADVLIKHSKVVIMIGQKLVDTLCQETGQKTIHKEVLSRSNQFCGRMKKVAVATKNAVMQRNPTTVQEMKEQVAVLRQQADQLRLLLEQNVVS